MGGARGNRVCETEKGGGVKICTSCKHFVRTLSESFCGRYGEIQEPVFGSWLPGMPAIDERTSYGQCGPDGKFYEEE